MLAVTSKMRNHRRRRDSATVPDTDHSIRSGRRVNPHELQSAQHRSIRQAARPRLLRDRL